MAKKIPPLTDSQLRGLTAGLRVIRKFDGANGLFLEVLPNGSKFWRVRYLFEGRRRDKTLGRYPQMSLKEARARAADWLPVLMIGKNPTAKDPAAMTFGELAGQWRERFMTPASLAPATIKRKSFILDKHILPAIGHLALSQIAAPVILERLLRPLEARGLLETATRAREMTGTVFRYGMTSEAQLEKDPTYGLQGALRPPATKHYAGITDPRRLGELLRAIEDYHGSLSVKFALQLLPLVFTRPGELLRADWREIDWPKQQWVIPAGRMKMRRDHVVPLARQSLTLLEELRAFTGPDGFWFKNMRHVDRPMSENTLNAALRAMGFGPDEVVSHGFRTTASTLLNEMGYRPDLIERQLAHSEKNAVRGAYNRAEYLEERRSMMLVWADYLDKLKAEVARPATRPSPLEQRKKRTVR